MVDDPRRDSTAPSADRASPRAGARPAWGAAFPAAGGRARPERRRARSSTASYGLVEEVIHFGVERFHHVRSAIARGEQDDVGIGRRRACAPRGRPRGRRSPASSSRGSPARPIRFEQCGDRLRPVFNGQDFVAESPQRPFEQTPGDRSSSAIRIFISDLREQSIQLLGQRSELLLRARSSCTWAPATSPPRPSVSTRARSADAASAPNAPRAPRSLWAARSIMIDAASMKARRSFDMVFGALLDGTSRRARRGADDRRRRGPACPLRRTPAERRADSGRPAQWDRRRLMQHVVHQGEQVRRPHRLRQIAVRAGGEAGLAIALHRVGGERDDRDAAAPCRASAARIAAVASKPSISGICMSIRTRSNRLARQRPRRPAGPCRRRPRCSRPFAASPAEPLVHRVVLREQDAQRRRCAVAAGRRPLPARRPPVRPSALRIAASSTDCRTGLVDDAADAELARSGSRRQ